MKKIYYLRLWLIAAMLSIAYSASAYDVYVNGFFYNLNITDRTAEVTKGEYSGDINIASAFIYNGIKFSVTSIGEKAFEYCYGLTSVTIPNSVTSIGGRAFYGCSGLTSVTIPNSVTAIGCAAFLSCDRLKEVHISDLAAWCKINFEYAVSNPLYYAHNLYLNGELITDLVIPNSVTSIGAYAFCGCSGLTSVTIPNSVTSIGNSAFSHCSGLTSVTIPNSVTSIGADAFSWCSGLTSVTIPNSVTSIGVGTFRYCSGLTSVTIPNSVTSIGKLAFGGCSGLTSVTIPNSVTSIGNGAFQSCTELTSVTIPNSVTSIDQFAFAYCSGLTKITIPKSVKTIGYKAFECNNELEVYVEWDDPSDETLSFDQQPFSNNIFQQGTLYVPTGTKSLYGQTEPWKNFVNIVEYAVDGIEEIEAEGGVTIGVEGGKIVVNGAGDAKVEVFGTNGAAVYSGSADNLPELAAGIYIVRIGSTVKKVAIAK